MSATTLEAIATKRDQAKMDPGLPATILVVEDEESIRDMLTFTLENAGHTLVSVANVPSAKKILAEHDVELVLVDWMLPGGSGLSLVKSIRENEASRDLPVIMLTARAEEEDITAGLDAGADDYVTKPFSPKELQSRIKALLRRSRERRANNTVLTVGPLAMDTAAHRVVAHTSTIELGHTEFKLLRFFMENTERVFSRSQLLDSVWGTDTFIEERTVDVHILRLRKALKPSGADELLQTVRGAGYRLTKKT